MRVLLDTHAFLWFVLDDPRLSARARDLIRSGENEVFLSTASTWEMAIKVSIGKLTLTQPLAVFLPEQVRTNAISLLDVSLAHTLRVATLPLHHRDPLDRLPVAQALEEDITFLSADAVVDAYDVRRLW